MLLMYVVWKLVKKTKTVKLAEMDLDTDTYVVEEEKTEEKPWVGKVRRVRDWVF